MKTISFALLCSCALGGCSSIEMIDGVQTQALPASSCQVTVFQTRAQAAKHGEIEELCIISGTSSGSFSHTVATAIAKHKAKACECGATKVYVESRREMTMDVATVTMVAFRYASNSKAAALE